MDYSDLTTLALNIMGDDPTTPKRWTAGEVEFAVNQSIKRLGTRLTPWTRETTVNVTDASDTYTLSNDTADVFKISSEESMKKLGRVAPQALPTDGGTGEPSVFAVLDSGPTVTTSKALVFYPAPEQNYTYIVTESYQPKADTTDTLPLPFPFDAEDAITHFTCYYLSMKPTASSSESDSQRYLKLAMDSLAQMSQWAINAEEKWGRGYFDIDQGITYY